VREGDAAFEALREAIDELAAGEASELIAEARIEARAKVRSVLAEAMAQALLDRSSALLSGEGVEVPGWSRDTTAPSARSGPPRATGSSPRAEVEPGAGAQVVAAVQTGAAEAADAHPRSEPRPKANLDDEGSLRDGAETHPPEAEQELGWYVYAVIAAEPFEQPDLGGVDARYPVAEIEKDGLAAVASRVPLAEFAEERLRENLNDVGWLEETARTHEHVLEAVLAQTTVIPMRLCTVYASEESVREMLDREHAILADALERLQGKTEWGVKAFVDREALRAAASERNAELRALRAENEGLPEGEAYMKRRRLDTLAEEQADLLADACVDEIHARLAAHASEALLNPLQRPEVSGRGGEMLLNGVYLVDDRAADSFHAAVDELGSEHGSLGFEIELTGPWPAYNFVKGSIEAAR